LERELKQLREEKESVEEKVIELEVGLELATEEAAKYKQQSEHVAMAATNRYNALIVKNDEELATIKNGLVNPLIRNNEKLQEALNKAWAERDEAEKTRGVIFRNHKLLEESVKRLVDEREKEVWEYARKKFIKEVNVIETQTEISVPPNLFSKDDENDSAAIRFQEDLREYMNSLDPKHIALDKRGLPARLAPYSFIEYCAPGEHDTEEEREEHIKDYHHYISNFKPPPTPQEKKRASVCTAQELLEYRNRTFSEALAALSKEKAEMVKTTVELNRAQKELLTEREKYMISTAKQSKQLFDYSLLARKLSDLPEQKYKQTQKKFFSYPINEWADKFNETFSCNRFAFLDVVNLSLEESKDLFTLLTEINRHTGSKSHIWYGNELNRRFNHKDATKRPKNTQELIRRAQETFVGWLNADATLGYEELQSDLVTKNSIAYSKLLNSIGNVSVKRAIFTG
jgi:hypothetical protein